MHSVLAGILVHCYHCTFEEQPEHRKSTISRAQEKHHCRQMIEDIPCGPMAMLRMTKWKLETLGQVQAGGSPLPPVPGDRSHFLPCPFLPCFC